MLIRYSLRASTWLKDCPLHIQERILDKINFFASQDNPQLYAVKIKGTPFSRFRIGDYRAICKIGNGYIDISIIGKRDEIYNNI
jgi:mRNA-degrading endonuclease RelE of RelBE toxin-antitoxin system